LKKTRCNAISIAALQNRSPCGRTPDRASSATRWSGHDGLFGVRAMKGLNMKSASIFVVATLA